VATERFMRGNVCATFGLILVSQLIPNGLDLRRK
jgi:hypothetical protein